MANKITAADLAKVKKFASSKKSSVLVIFFDDIESSGLVKQNLGEADYQKIRKYHDRTLEEIINKKNEGEVVKSLGDGLFAIFYSPSIAVERAIEIQKTLYNHPYLKIRIGMDMGQVLEDSSPGHTRDFFGPAVDCASRVMSMAKGGHILATSSVYRDAVAILDRKLVTWKKHGLYKKKETDQPVDNFSKLGLIEGNDNLPSNVFSSKFSLNSSRVFSFNLFCKTKRGNSRCMKTCRKQNVKS